eukprot:TRINITY_DN5922_c0_g1_i1.p1 TRINITY_DN5922_c0_g1~~TRINITY_DN5922_c0_g1_i1.p1  ORF type:complete len:1000 (-),score=270.84 TRINITY_DN5922_c0_g1_i1:355-3354(-)
MSYDFRAVEESVRQLWESDHTYDRARAQARATGRAAYFLDGPPYTSGHVHLGTAWNKSLKDVYLRYKRMSGWDVWDRAGYDMHGLPTERATEKALQIYGKAAIREYGVDKFVDKCKQMCIDNAHEMNVTFKFMGVWMDFDNAYMSVDREYIEGVWWFVKRAAEAGRLYEAEKTMTWDAVNATALAKHELEYHTVTDNAIYVRLPVKSEAGNEYLIVWTTTPWTVPYNLAVMAGPDIDYVRVDLVHAGARQRWVLADARVQSFLVGELGLTETNFSVVWRGKGRELAGLAYEHPLAGLCDAYAALQKASPKVHTVVLSAQFVDTETGTGLVHCAPGCGPEDYVVGQENGIAPFNTVDEAGVVNNLGPMTGLRAKVDDDKFIELLEKQGALVHRGDVTHEYPFGERSKEPVIFRTTKQWFLRVEDLKERLLAENAGINWVPLTAKNAFSSWLSSLRDNSISKQRFWGTPLPIWRNVDCPEDYVVVGTADELCALAGLPAGSLIDLHPPVVDKIAFTRVSPQDGRAHVYRRVPDVLDVWVDAGSASWNCLRASVDAARAVTAPPAETPAEFILEGRDQIRGWFNLLHLESMVALGKPCFRNVYMHGFVNDALGRKMSKTQGNYILPSEVWDKYGVDTLRYYSVCAANPGEDMSYNAADVEQAHRNLGIFWNIHKYLLSTAEAVADVAAPVPITACLADLGTEERYILSRLHGAVRDSTTLYEQFRLDRAPCAVCDFLMEVSHVYIQLVWEKKDSGTPADKRAVVSTLAACLLGALPMLATVCPFITEKMYQNIRAAPCFGTLCTADSVHLLPWPTCGVSLLDTSLEADVAAAKDAVAAILTARERADLPVKQPAREARIACPARLVPLLQRTVTLVTSRTNIKSVHFGAPPAEVTVEPNQKTLGKTFGRSRQRLAAHITEHADSIAAHIAATGAVPWSAILKLDDGKEVALTEEHLVVARRVPACWAEARAGEVTAYVDTTRTPELEIEGRVRELARKVWHS